eukprot:gene4370-14494_t
MMYVEEASSYPLIESPSSAAEKLQKKASVNITADSLPNSPLAEKPSHRALPKVGGEEVLSPGVTQPRRPPFAQSSLRNQPFAQTRRPSNSGQAKALAKNQNGKISRQASVSSIQSRQSCDGDDDDDDDREVEPWRWNFGCLHPEARWSLFMVDFVTFPGWSHEVSEGQNKWKEGNVLTSELLRFMQGWGGDCGVDNGKPGGDNGSGSSGLSGGAIAGIVIGVLVAFALLACLIYVLRQRLVPRAPQHRLRNNSGLYPEPHNADSASEVFSAPAPGGGAGMHSRGSRSRSVGSAVSNLVTSMLTASSTDAGPPKVPLSHQGTAV